MTSSEAVTRGVRVQVQSRYEPDRSSPEEHHWFFVYEVRIRNEGLETVQLLNRHWYITDALGLVQEVQGPGVVGQQPVLGPGEAFEYTSACPLNTSFGTMHGTYEMVLVGGEHFDAEIAPFALGEPQSIH